MTISFGGIQIKRPGSYSVVSTETNTIKNSGGFKILAVVGRVGTDTTITGDDLNKVHAFNSPSDARTKVGAISSTHNEEDTLLVMNAAWDNGADLILFSPLPHSSNVTDANWQTAIDRLELQPVDAIIPVTTAEGIIAKIKTHVNTMSNTTNRKERRAFIGHDTTSTNSQILGIATTQNSERVVLASPAVVVKKIDNTTATKPSYILAGAYAGKWASQGYQENLTYKYINTGTITDLATKHTSTAIIDFVDGKVAVSEFVYGKGLRIVKGVTTSSDTDITKTELSIASLVDFMSKDIREYFEDNFVGIPAVAGIESSVYVQVISKIEEYLKNGYISGYDAKKVSATRSDSIITITWEATPTIPVNNFLITSTFTL